MNTKNTGRMKRSAGASRHRDVDGARFGTEGSKLFKWCSDHFDNIDRVLPIVEELCQLQDRLEQVRRELRKSPDPKLINAECKLSAAFARAWRLAGFGDAPPKGRVGRPGGLPVQRLKTGLGTSGLGVVS